MIAMGIKHAERIERGAAGRARTSRPEQFDDVLRREPAGAVLRQEPRARPGRRARRDHPLDRLRQERRRPAALPLRAPAHGGRRATAQRGRHPGEAAHDPGLLVRPSRHGPGRCKPRGASCCAPTWSTREQRRATSASGGHRRPKLNPFEVDVRDSLTRAGHPARRAVRRRATASTSPPSTPTQPGRMVLAIECDGASLPLLASRPRPRPPAPGAPGAARLARSTASGRRTGSPTSSPRSPRRRVHTRARYRLPKSPSGNWDAEVASSEAWRRRPAVTERQRVVRQPV